MVDLSDDEWMTELEELDVLVLGRPDVVKVDLWHLVDLRRRAPGLRRHVVEAVEEATPVRQPGNAACPPPTETIREVLAGGHVADPPALPVGANGRHAVGDEASIRADLGRDDSEGPGQVKVAGVEQDAGAGAVQLLHP